MTETNIQTRERRLRRGHKVTPAKVNPNFSYSEQSFIAVKRKSQAGVEYTKYKPVYKKVT